MLFQFLLLIAGFAILVKSSDYFIESVVSMARWLEVSEFFIGVTVVSIGTSLPELGTAFFALLHLSPGLVMGNVVGANIVAMSLVVGVIAIMTGLMVQRDILNYDLPALVSISFLFWLFSTGGSINWLEGLMFLVVYFAYTISIGEKRMEVVHSKIFEKRKMVYLVISLVGIIVGAEMVVSSALGISEFLGMSATVVGLTIVSMGTTLPELMVSFMSVWKGEKELALGNITGSVLFNLCVVLGLSALFMDIPTGEIITTVSFPVMVGLTLILGVMAMDKNITRFDGIVLLAIYFGFLGIIL